MKKYFASWNEIDPAQVPGTTALTFLWWLRTDRKALDRAVKLLWRQSRLKAPLVGREDALSSDLRLTQELKAAMRKEEEAAEQRRQTELLCAARDEARRASTEDYEPF
jgi:hypothetical protein